MSKSWIIMSKKMPPETLRYSKGLCTLSRQDRRIICGVPTSPEYSVCLTLLWFVSKRRIKPVWNFTPAFSTSRSAA